jgi:halocyanin-like protein
MTDSGRPDRSRRTALATIAAGLGASLTGCLGVTGSSRPADFDGWFDDVSNYDGVVSERAADEVEITVGATGNGGNFGFAPAAVRVSTGTTVVWRWNGKGSIHNVVAESGRFESELTARAGATFEHAFDTAGTYRYYCDPHRRSGMKGVVVVE